MSIIHLKSLSGDIISLSLSNILNDDQSNLIDIWDRVISFLACQKKCDVYQVVIFEGEEE